MIYFPFGATYAATQMKQDSAKPRSALASEEKCLCAKPAPIKNIWHITFGPKLLSV